MPQTSEPTRSFAPPEHRLLGPDVDPAEVVQWWKQRIENRPLFVYFIQDGDEGAIKIGKAHDPAGRLSELQCGNPRVLTLRAVVLADEYSTEGNLHVAWAQYRARGEWFGSGLRGEGQPDRYRTPWFVRIQPADHPSVQAEILRGARAAQAKQIEARIAGAAESDIADIATEIIRPPASWPGRGA